MLDRNFACIIPEKGTYTFDIVLPKDIVVNESTSVLLYAYNTLQASMRGTFILVTKSKELEMLTFDNTGYFLRVYPEKGQNILEILKGSYIKANVIEPADLTIVSMLKGEVTVVEEEEYEAIGDYVIKDQKNCYATSLLSEGGTIVIQLDNPNINLYMNPAVFTHDLRGFAYKYLKTELTFAPSEANFGSIIVPVPKSHVSPNELTYFCVEGTSSGLVYTVEVKPEITYPILDIDQPQKVYLKRNETILLYYSNELYEQTNMKLNVKVEKGSANVLVKPAISYYQAYILSQNASQGIDPFTNVNVEDSVWLELTPNQGEVVKSVPNVKKGRPIFFVLGNYNPIPDSMTVVTLRITFENPIQVFPADPISAAMLPKSKEFIVLPAVSPAVDKVELKFIIRPRMKLVKLGRVGVSRKGIQYDVSKAEKTIELDGNYEVYTIEFAKTKEVSLEGNYYLTIEAFEALNVKIMANITSFENGNETKVVTSLNQPPAKGMHSLTSLGGDKYAGYFTYYLNNTAQSKPHDFLISPLGVLPFLEKALTASTIAWPDNTTNMWKGDVIRVSKNDKNYAQNSYYYFSFNAVTMPQQGVFMMMESNPSLIFTILEETQANELMVEKPYRFDETKLFVFNAKGQEDYVIKKSSSTGESMYVSLSPKNTIPFADKYHFMKKAEKQMEAAKIPEQSEVIIGRNDLKKYNPECADIDKNCPVYITVHCPTQACIYDIVIEKVANNVKEANDTKSVDEKVKEPKTDL